jgi:hypothetical protein
MRRRMLKCNFVSIAALNSQCDRVGGPIIIWLPVRIYTGGLAAAVMLTATAYFHDVRFLSILAILAAILTVLGCRTIASRMSTLIFLVLCHKDTCFLISYGLPFMLSLGGSRVKPLRSLKIRARGQ